MTGDSLGGPALRRRILRGSASNVASRVIGIVTAFLLTPYILGRVGAVGYGLWVLVGSVAAYGALLDLGIGSAVIKYVAEYRAKGDMQHMRTLLATVLRLYLVLGFVAFGLSVLLAPLFPELVNVEPAQRQTVSLVVLLMGLNLGISIAAAPATSVLAGLQRFDLYNLVTTGGSLLWAAGTVVVLAAGWGVVGMVALTIPITVLSRVVSVRVIRRVNPELPFGYAGGSRAMARSVIGFSAPVLATQLSDLLQKKTDEIVIGSLLAVAAVTPYALGRRLSEIPHVLTSQFALVLLPVASELHATADVERLRTLYVVSTRLTVAIFLSVGLVVVVLAEPILAVWVGPGYEEAVPVIAILSLASFLLTSQWPAGSILQGMARFRLIAISSLASGFANLALSIVLGQRMGIVGVAIGTLVPTAAETVGFVLPYAMWVIGVGPIRAIREVWRPALLPALPAALILYGLRELVQPSSFLAVGLIAGCGVLVYFVVYLSFSATARERKGLADARRQVIAAAEQLRGRHLPSKPRPLRRR